MESNHAVHKAVCPTEREEHEGRLKALIQDVGRANAVLCQHTKEEGGNKEGGLWKHKLDVTVARQAQLQA